MIDLGLSEEYLAGYRARLNGAPFDSSKSDEWRMGWTNAHQGQHFKRSDFMRLIDAEELNEHVWRDRLDSRELIAHMVDCAPTIDRVWVVSYYDEGEAPVVTVFDNEFAAIKCCNALLRLEHHTKVDCDECQIYKTFTVNGK